MERVSRRLQELAHTAVEEEALVQGGPMQPEEPSELVVLAQSTEQEAIDITNLSNTESDCGEDMVTRKTMTINCFVPGARQAGQQRPPQGQGQTPPPPLPPPQTVRIQKRPRVVEQTSTGLGDVVTQVTPQPSRGVTIQEP